MPGLSGGGSTAPLGPLPDGAPVVEAGLDAAGELLLRTEEHWYRASDLAELGSSSRTSSDTRHLGSRGRWRATESLLTLDDQPVLEADRALMGLWQLGTDLWLLSDGVGLMRVRPSFMEVHHTGSGALADLTYNVLAREDGVAWMGTATQGLWRLGETATRIDTGPGWRGANILSLSRDGADVLVGTDLGACRVTPGAEDCAYFFALDDGTVFNGTRERGVLRVRGDRMRRFTTADGLKSDSIRSFWAHEDQVFVGTEDAGVCLIEGEAVVRCVDTRDGLHEDCASRWRWW